MRDEYIDEMVTTPFRSVLKKIYTPEEVDATFHGQKGTMLVFIDSNCGCAGRIARPALELAVGHYHKPDEFVTTFASIDRDATARDLILPINRRLLHRSPFYEMVNSWE
jgi:putative YphP/YqiW family bacilliredoxin